MVRHRTWVAAAIITAVACSLAMPATARADANSCQRGIARASAAYVDGRSRALARCQVGKTKGRIRAGDACADDPRTFRVLDTLRVNLFAAINRACGGGNHDCGDDDDLPLPETGWIDVPACPGFLGSGCTNAITTCSGIAACLECIGARAVDQTVATATDAFDSDTFGTSSPANRCRQAINKAVSRFAGTRAKVLRRCWDARLRGRHANPCPDPGDEKAVGLLARAEKRTVDTICHACGGADRLCNGAGDLTPAAIGFAPTCPDVSTRDGSRCGGPVADLDDLVRCIDCVAEADTDCAHAAAVPEMLTYPAACTAGPTTTTTTTVPTTTATSTTATSSTTSTSSTSTSSSSTSSTSTTAASSTTTTASSSTTTSSTGATTTTTASSTTTTTISAPVTCGPSNFLDVTATLDYEPRIVGGVFGMFLEVDYPASVGLPGSGTASSARARFTNLIGTNYRFVASDLDSNADGQDDRGRTLVTANTSEPIPNAPIERVRFDCPSGTVVQPPQFACRPAETVDSAGQLFPPPVAALITCSLSFAAP
jgi:hypothetical protein